MTTLPKLLCCNDSIQIYTSLLQQNEHIVSQTLSLHDPASLQRMQVPCRAFDCEHLQCFDYSVVLLLNKSNERSFFRCSVCNETRNPDKIYIDFVTFALLRLYKCSESFKLYRDGTLRPSGTISPEFQGYEINNIFDIKKLCVLPSFQSSSIRLRQLLYSSVFDINDYINKSGSAVLLKLIGKGCRKLPSKDAELTLGIDKLRPFNSNTWLGLQHSFQTLPSVGEKKGASLVKDLREEYDKVSLNHLNKITSGPLDVEENQLMMSICGAVHEIEKIHEVMVDLCGDDDDDDFIDIPTVKTVIKTSSEAPSSSSLSLSAAVPTTVRPPSTASSSTSSPRTVIAPSDFNRRSTIQSVQSVSGPSSSSSLLRQQDTPNAAIAHRAGNSQGAVTLSASNSLPHNAHVSVSHISNNDSNRNSSRDIDNLRLSATNNPTRSDQPQIQHANVVPGRLPSAPPNNFNVPLPLRRENGVYPERVRARSNSSADGAFNSSSSTSTAPSPSSSSSSSVTSLVASHSNAGSGNTNQGNSSVRPHSAGVMQTVGPTASISKPPRKRLTGANNPGGVSRAIICRGGGNMQVRIPRVNRGVVTEMYDAHETMSLLLQHTENMAAYNRLLNVKRVTQSTQTEAIDITSTGYLVTQGKEVESSMNSRLAECAISSAEPSRNIPTDALLGVRVVNNSITEPENPTLYWLDPTGILMEEQSPSNLPVRSVGAGTSVPNLNRLDEDGDVTMDFQDYMDDDAQAILCEEIDQMDCVAIRSFDAMGGAVVRRHVDTNFEAYEVNSNYSTSDCDSVDDNAVLSQSQNFNGRNSNSGSSSSSASASGSSNNNNLNSSTSTSDSLVLNTQSTVRPISSPDSAPNILTNMANSSIINTNDGRIHERGQGSSIAGVSSSSSDTHTQETHSSSSRKDANDSITDGSIIETADNSAARCISNSSAGILTLVTSTSSADAGAPANGLSTTTADPDPDTALAVNVGMSSAIEQGHLAVGGHSAHLAGSSEEMEIAQSQEMQECDDSEYFTAASPVDSGDTTESEGDMIDVRVRRPRKSTVAAGSEPEIPADSAGVADGRDSAGMGVDTTRAVTTWREEATAAWAVMQTETETEADNEDSQALNTSQSIASATESEVDVTSPINSIEPVGDITASTALSPPAADAQFQSMSSAVNGEIAACRAEPFIPVHSAPATLTSTGALLQVEFTAMTTSDPNTSSLAPDSSHIVAEYTSGDVPPSNQIEQIVVRTTHADTTHTTRVLHGSAASSSSSSSNDRIYNSSGRCNAGNIAPCALPLNHYRRKVPLDIYSASAESINRDAVDSSVPPPTFPSLVSVSPPLLPTVTAVAAPILESLQAAGRSLSFVPRQVVLASAAMNTPSIASIQQSCSTLTTSTPLLLPSSSVTASIPTAVPATSILAHPSPPTEHSTDIVIPPLSLESLLTPAQIGNSTEIGSVSVVDQTAAVALLKEGSADLLNATLPKRKSATASPRISTVQDPGVGAGVTPHIVVESSALPMILPANNPAPLALNASESVSSEQPTLSKTAPQGDRQIFAADEYGFWDESTEDIVTSVQGNGASQSVGQAEENGQNAQRSRSKNDDCSATEKKKLTKKAEKARRLLKQARGNGREVAEWAYRLAKGTQCTDLSMLKRHDYISTKRLTQWNRAVSKLRGEGHYNRHTTESTAENEPAAPSTISSATSTIATDVPVPSQPTVHATTVGAWKCGKCRSIIDGNYHLCTECNTARPTEGAVRSTDILRRCPSCSITPSVLPCAACAAMVPATRTAFRPMTSIPKVGKERRSALAHEKTPLVAPVNMSLGANKRPLPSDGPSSATLADDLKNKQKVAAANKTTSSVARDQALYMAALNAGKASTPAPNPAPAPAPARPTVAEKMRKARAVVAPTSSSSAHSSVAATTVEAARLSSKIDTPKSAIMAVTAPASAAKAGAPIPSSTTQALFIDLTLDDDDDNVASGRAKQSAVTAGAGAKPVSYIIQDFKAKRTFSSAFVEAECDSHGDDAAGARKKSVKKSPSASNTRETGSNPSPLSSTSTNVVSMAPPKPPPPIIPRPPSSAIHKPVSSSYTGTSSMAPPRAPSSTIPKPQSSSIPKPQSSSSSYTGTSSMAPPRAPSSLNVNTPSSSIPKHPSSIGLIPHLNPSHNSVQARPHLPDKRPGPAASHGEKARPMRPPTTKSIPANITLTESDSQETFNELCVNDFSF